MARRIKEDIINVRFRTSKTWTTALSKAKFFYIYSNKKQIFRGEFLNVRDRVVNKSDLIYEAINELIYVGKIKVAAPEKKPKKPKKVKPLGKFTKRETVIVHSKTIGCDIEVDKAEWELFKKIKMNPQNFKKVKLILRDAFIEPAIGFYKEAWGERFFIMRLMFDRAIKVKGKKHYIKDGIGTFRVQAKTLQQFVENPFTELFHKINLHVKNYFTASLNNELLIKGFSIENLTRFL